MPLHPQKNPAVRVDKATSGSRFFSEMATSGSSVYVTWADRRNIVHDIYFVRSLDGGATWPDPDVKLNHGAGWQTANLNQGVPKIAASGSSVYVTWEDYRAGTNARNIYFNRSLNAGATWLATDVQLNTVTSTTPLGRSPYAYPQIAASGSSVYVVWSDSRNGQGSEDIYFNRSLDGGSTWLATDVRLNSSSLSGSSAWNPQVVASESSVYVTWEDKLAGTSHIYFNRSLDRGATWLAWTPRLDQLPAIDSHLPRIAAWEASVYVTWASTDGNIYFNRSLDGGTTWLPPTVPPVRLSSSAGSFGYPVIAVSRTSVYVAWKDTWPGPDNVYCNSSLDSGATWLVSEAQLNTVSNWTTLANLSPHTVPGIAASESSVYVTWLGQEGGIEWGYLNRSLDGGATWLGSEVRMDTGVSAGFAISDPRVAASESSVYVTWSRGAGTYFNIPFGFQPYGVGTAGSGGLAPDLAGTGLAITGRNVSIDVTNGLGAAAGAVLIGGSGAKTSLPLLGGTVLVLPLTSVPMMLNGTAGAKGAGTGSLPLSIPNVPGAYGVDLYFQGVFLDGAAPFGLSMTHGIEMWIG